MGLAQTVGLQLETRPAEGKRKEEGS